MRSAHTGDRSFHAKYNSINGSLGASGAVSTNKRRFNRTNWAREMSGNCRDSNLTVAPVPTLSAPMCLLPMCAFELKPTHRQRLFASPFRLPSCVSCGPSGGYGEGIYTTRMSYMHTYVYGTNGPVCCAFVLNTSSERFSFWTQSLQKCRRDTCAFTK